MRSRSLSAVGAVLIALHAPAVIGAEPQPLPIRNGRPILATVGAATIALDELAMQIGAEPDRARLRRGMGTANELQILDRLITIKLLVQEAETMGLADLPQIRKQVEVQSREILREVLMQRLVKGVTASPAAVERLYRESVREWKTTSLLFQEESAARQAQKDVASGTPFSRVSAAAVASKKARTEGDNGYHPRSSYLPQIGEALAKLPIGGVSPLISLPGGFVLVKVADIRYPEQPTARAEARHKALTLRQQEYLKAHTEGLVKQYAVIDSALLDSIDYTAAKPGVDALLKDKRVIARIKGGGTLTVGDLTDYLRLQFFHGTDQVKQRKEMNEKKKVAFHATLERRLLNLEAARLGIDTSNEYRDRLNGYRESLVFNAFVDKVIAPESKMKEEEVKGYYAGHLNDYSYPEMMKVRSLAFSQRPAAETALRKLRDGTDYGWMAANAEGQVARGTEGVLALDGQPVTTESMPEGVRKALEGTKAGDLRLYASPDKRFYVLAVQQVIANGAKPYSEVREDIARKLYSEKLTKSIAAYSGKLRAHAKVTTYLTGVQ